MVAFGRTLESHRTQAGWPYVEYERHKLRILRTQRHAASQELLRDVQYLDGTPITPTEVLTTFSFVKKVAAEAHEVNACFEEELHHLEGVVVAAASDAERAAGLERLSCLHEYVCVNYLAILKITKKYDKYVRALQPCQPEVRAIVEKQAFYAAMRDGTFGRMEARLRAGASQDQSSAPAAADLSEREVERLLGSMATRYFPLPTAPRIPRKSLRISAIAELPWDEALASVDDEDLRARRWALYANLGTTYVAYACVMTCRRALSVAKKPIEDAMGINAVALGAHDSAMLVAYLAMQLFMSRYADRLGVPPKSLIILAIVGSAISTAATGWQSTASAMLPFWVANGLCQAALYPQICLVLNAWLEGKGKGRAMAIWNTAVPFGSALSAGVSAVALPRRGWRGAFEGPAAVALTSAVLVAVFLTPRPPGAPPPTPSLVATASFSSAPPTPRFRDRSEARSRAPPVWNLCFVRPMALAYLVLKPIRYLFLFWGNYFQLSQLELQPLAAGVVELFGTMGGMAGGVVCGMLADRFYLGTVFVPISLFLAVFLVAFPIVSAWSFAWDVAIVTATSALIGALDNIGSGVTGAAIVDLNEQLAPPGPGGHVSIASVVAFIAALGSVGTLIQGRVLAVVVEQRGWHAVFWLAALQAAFGALLLLPTCSRPNRGTTKRAKGD